MRKQFATGTLLLAFAAGILGGVHPSLAKDCTQSEECTYCEENNRPNGPLTQTVHDNHDIAGEQVGEILHEDVEPATCG